MFFRFAHLLAGSLAVLGARASVIALTPDTFDDVVLANKPALVEFFAPWCGHCKKLAPIYAELGAQFGAVSNLVSIASVDADEHRTLGQRFGITGFPTIKWFDGKSETPEDYNGGRDLESLVSFIKEKTGAEPKPKKQMPSVVTMLNDTTFESTIGKDKDVFVAFTAPWCQHCQTLRPVWEEIGHDFANEPSVVVARFNVEAADSKKMAEKLSIAALPTIRWYPKGTGAEAPILFDGERSEEDIVQFINSNAGTHRLPGGGLDRSAGTIAALDTLVSKFTGGEGVASVSKEVKAAAAGLKDKYAEYYVRIFDKLAANEGYVEKETARLAGILKKGGLSPAKVDDVISRSNILNRFKKVVTGEKSEL